MSRLREGDTRELGKCVSATRGSVLPKGTLERTLAGLRRADAIEALARTPVARRSLSFDSAAVPATHTTVGFGGTKKAGSRTLKDIMQILRDSSTFLKLAR